MSTKHAPDADRAARRVLALTQALLSGSALGDAGAVPAMLGALLRELTEGDAAFNRRIASTTVCEKTGHTLATRAAYCHGAHWASRGLLRILARAGLDLSVPDAAGRLPLLQGLANTGVKVTPAVLAWVWSMAHLDPLTVETATGGHGPRSLWSLDFSPGPRAGFGTAAHQALERAVLDAIQALPTPGRGARIQTFLAAPVHPFHQAQAARLRNQLMEQALPVSPAPRPAAARL